MKTRPVKVFERFHTGRAWETRTKCERATFHGFSLDIEEDEKGFSSYAVAVVELQDGTVILPRADCIQFLDVEAS